MPHDDLYDDEPDSNPMPSKEKSAETESENALLPKSFFQGKDLEPGKHCKVEVVRVFDDEVEVRYIRHDEKKKEMTDREPAEEDEMMV